MNRLVDLGKQLLHILYAVWGYLRHVSDYQRLCIIGVTGTDGKSSTVLYTAEMLRRSGHNVAHYSSVSIHDGIQAVSNTWKMTTPGLGKLHKFLGHAAQNGCTHAVIELTSEGIRQWRHFGIQLDVLAFTNVSPEHIERHGSFDRYVETKLRLLRQVKHNSKHTITRQGVCIFNAEDEVLLDRLKTIPNTKAVSLVTDKTAYDPFRHKNILLAEAIVAVVGGAPSDLSDMQIPGRFEYYPGKPSVIVDYAHTVKALAMCLAAARKLTSGKLIHVFGAAGGGRDRWKRSKLAELSECYADIHILTEENSFDEPTKKIIEEIKVGFSNTSNVYVCLHREDAVTKAFSLASPKDLVICTAKGSETVIAGPNRTYRSYNELEFVKQCLEQNQSL